MRNGAIVSMLVIAVLVSAGAGYFIGTFSERATTSTTTSTVTSWSTSTIPSLEMIANVSPSVVTAGQNVSINFGVYNALSVPSTINVTAYRNQYLGPCFEEIPITYYIYSGHATFSNLTFSTPLLLYNVSLAVPCFAAFNATWTFRPHSDNATVFAPHFTPPGSLPPVSLNATLNYSGFWVRGPGSGYSFNIFTPGRYTVLVNDSWGQQELEYFTVNP